MARSRPFGLFILALCLVACVCAHAVVSRDEAAKIVNDVRQYTKKQLDDLKAEIDNAIQLRNKAKTYKENAEAAAKEAEKAAKGNPDAEAIAETAKKASAEVLKLYPNAFDLANKYAESMKTLRTRAKVLNDKANTELFVSEWKEDDYTKTKEDADAIKTEAVAFHNEVQEAMKPYSAMEDAQKEIPNFASSAQLAKYHVDAVVAVAKIDTLLKSADTDIELTEQKKAEINVTEQEMKNLSDNSPKDLINYISRLHSIVEDHARSASREVKKAKEAKTHMLEQKAHADEALVKVKAEKNVDNAESEAGVAHQAVKDAEEQNEEIKKALESATRYATEALRWKKDAVNELNRNTKKPDVTQDNDKTNSQDSANTHQPVQDTTESPEVSGTKKPTITNPDQSITEQPVKDTTESPTMIGTKKPTITNPDQSITEQPVKDTTESPTMIGTKKPTITNPDQTGSGGTEPTHPSSNDSAMTVSVSLLLTLIVCAALH